MSTIKTKVRSIDELLSAAPEDYDSIYWDNILHAVQEILQSTHYLSSVERNEMYGEISSLKQKVQCMYHQKVNALLLAQRGINHYRQNNDN